jgi:GntR family transcriptional regulator, arabinose operon transcriptional repressor
MKSRKSKTQEIYEFLKKEIVAGTYTEGELLPTDLQISEKFQTSRPTVAKAVQRLVDENILGRKAGYGTYIKTQNASLIEGKELNLGLLIPALGETEIFEPICGQIASLADEHNFSLVWGGGGTSMDSSSDVAVQLAQKYINQKVDGVFFTPLELSAEAMKMNDKIIRMFNAAQIPVVLLDSDVVSAPLKSEHDVIGINNTQAGFVIGQHLLERKCKKLGFITRPYIASTVHMRLIGLREAVIQAGLGLESVEIFNSEKSIEDLAKEISQRQDLDALAVYNDAAAAELSVALNDLGLNIPEDLKICAFDDVKYAKLLKTPLSTYKQPCRDIGTAAVETMISRIKNPDLCARKVLLHGELIIRQSTT